MDAKDLRYPSKIKCSVCLATWNKADILRDVLDSMCRQSPPFGFEVIVADDGSTDATAAVCRDAPVKYIHLESEGERGSAVARNAAYRAAVGEIIIAQSDDVVHGSDTTLARLVEELHSGEFVLATVRNVHPGTTESHGLACSEYTGRRRIKPYFFLGALWRADLYAVGGNDEDFTEMGGEDVWFADCLVSGSGLRWRILDDVIGYHQSHSYSPTRLEENRRMDELRLSKLRNARSGKGPYCAASGPWEYAP
ncbi:hypothetical protein LCGC14_1163790 [marine sediment metagenome]|uniref:Glycosyltransferase 2-like domain-containing protein n=1 Tax=marine sediment metagenome TaxID=412755 RepID=A0A0F9PA41_9ZZZZ